MFQKILKLLRTIFVLVVALLKTIVNTGAHMGSFMYFVNTTVKVGKTIVMIVSSAATAKVARDMITSVEDSMQLSLDITSETQQS